MFATTAVRVKGILVDRRLLAAVLAAALLGTVVAANWLAATFGLVAAGFGFIVPAGTYAAGIALGLRDGLDRVGEAAKERGEDEEREGEDAR